MHNCGICGKTSQPGETSNRVVTDTRPKSYVGYFYTDKDGRKQSVEVNNSRRRTLLSFKEIVSEVLACNSCATNPSKTKKIGNTLVSVDVFNLLQGVKHAHA